MINLCLQGERRMKMKKTLAFIVTAALAIGTMAGCSQATLNYSQELSKTAQWEATTSNITGTISIDASGVKEDVNMTATGYAVKNQSHVDIKFTSKSGNFNIPELEAFSDGTTSYINKKFYEGIYTLNGQTVPEGLTNIKEKYIAIDTASTGVNVNQIKALTSKPDAMVELGKQVFGNSDIDLPFVQNGREFTMNLDANQTVDLTAKAIKAACNNIDKINTTFQLGLPPEAITQIKTEVNDPTFDTNLTEAKTALAGTTISSKEVFTDNSYNSEINIKLQIKDFGKIAIKLNSESTNSEKKIVIFPGSTFKTTQEEFNKLLVPTNTTIESSTNVVAK
jgi:hypothetical protein